MAKTATKTRRQDANGTEETQYSPPDTQETSLKGNGRPPATASFAAKHGLPPIHGYRQDFASFLSYWRSIPVDKRPNVTVYGYRLFPVINLPPGEHAVMTIPGEHPLGGEDGSAEEEVLAQKGLGDYWFVMKYATESASKAVCTTWLMGHKDNLPGWRDFQNHPPLIEGDIGSVVKLEDEKNIKSGYISYLQGIGAIKGAGQKENEDDMANEAAGTAAIGVLGKIAERAFDRQDAQQQPAAPAPAPHAANEHEWDAINRTIETVNEVHKQTAVNVPELIKTVAELTRQEPVPPQDLTPLYAQITALTERLFEAKGAEADELRNQLRELRLDMRSYMQSNAAQARAVSDAPLAAPVLDPMVEMGRKFMEKKLEKLLTDDDDEDDRPRRRRYAEDAPQPQPVKEEKSLMSMLVENLPFLMTAGSALLNGIATAAHNVQVARTGVGETIAPAPISMPGQPQQVQQGGNPLLPQQTQSQPQGDPSMFETPQQKAMKFLATIEAGLVGSLERNETGYEYAELFIKTTGRLGDFGYTTLHNAHTMAMLNTQGLPFPGGSVAAIAQVLHMHGGIWSKIGNDTRLALFLEQFVMYDEFLKDNDVANLNQLLRDFEVDTVADFLLLPDEPEEAEPIIATGEGADRARGQVILDVPPAVPPSSVPVPKRARAVPGTPVAKPS